MKVKNSKDGIYTKIRGNVDSIKPIAIELKQNICQNLKNGGNTYHNGKKSIFTVEDDNTAIDISDASSGVA